MTDRIPLERLTRRLAALALEATYRLLLVARRSRRRMPLRPDPNVATYWVPRPPRAIGPDRYERPF